MGNYVARPADGRQSGIAEDRQSPSAEGRPPPIFEDRDSPSDSDSSRPVPLFSSRPKELSLDFKYTMASSLLQRLCRVEERNFVFSPLSLGSCLAMAAVGLKGESRTQLLNFMKAPSQEELHTMFANLLTEGSMPLSIANKIVADKHYKVSQAAESFLKTNYQSEAETVDFVKDASEVVGNVNAWVSNKTHNKIPKLLSEADIGSDTILLLLNAIYFKGGWVDKFSALPEQQDFQLRDGRKVKKDFMKRRSKLIKYKKTASLCFVTVPYKESSFYMLLAIPTKDGENIVDVIAKTPVSELASMIDGARHGDRCIVTLIMPKFKIEYEFAGLPSHLKELGVSKMFSAVECDFGNMFCEIDGRNPYVSKIVHKAIIEVNETGTVAAAATALNMVGCALSLKPPPEIEVILDKPFCFWILSYNAMVSFAGICAEP